MLLVAHLAASQQTIERQAARVAELERENGRLAAALAIGAVVVLLAWPRSRPGELVAVEVLRDGRLVGW